MTDIIKALSMNLKGKPCCEDAIVKPNMFYWRGKYFSGLVCPTHNALFDNPADSFADYVANL